MEIKYYLYSVQQSMQTKTNIMETTMKLAIETYAKLTNITFNEALGKMQTNKVVQNSIMKLMFSVS